MEMKDGDYIQQRRGRKRPRDGDTHITADDPTDEVLAHINKDDGGTVIVWGCDNVRARIYTLYVVLVNDANRVVTIDGKASNCRWADVVLMDDSLWMHPESPLSAEVWHMIGKPRRDKTVVLFLSTGIPNHIPAVLRMLGAVVLWGRSYSRSYNRYMEEMADNIERHTGGGLIKVATRINNEVLRLLELTGVITVSREWDSDGYFITSDQLQLCDPHE